MDCRRTEEIKRAARVRVRTEWNVPKRFAMKILERRFFLRKPGSTPGFKLASLGGNDADHSAGRPAAKAKKKPIPHFHGNDAGATGTQLHQLLGYLLCPGVGIRGEAKSMED
jgi:hypothetical protein